MRAVADGGSCTGTEILVRQVKKVVTRTVGGQERGMSCDLSIALRVSSGKWNRECG